MMAFLIRPATGELWLNYLDDAKIASQLRYKKIVLSDSENTRDL